MDTAGVEDFEESKKYEDILNKTIEQTRKALIYSDLALFLIDARTGVTFTDIKLAAWMNKIRIMQEESEASKAKEPKEEVDQNEKEEDKDDEKNVSEILNDNGKNIEESFADDKLKSSKSRRGKWDSKKTVREKFYDKLKELKETDEIKIPTVKLIANKCEDNFVPDDVYCDFIKLKLGEPLLISAEHGDNMVTFNNYKIEKCIIYYFNFLL